MYYIISCKKCLVKEACKLREVAVHDNIVKLIGVLMETDNYGIILELMVFGNCLSFIKDYTGSIVNLSKAAFSKRL